MALERFDCHPIYLNHPKKRYILLYSSKRMNPNKIMLIPRLLNVHSPRLVAAERYSCRGHELHRNDGAPNAVVLKSVSALLLPYAREKDFGFENANWQCTCNNNIVLDNFFIKSFFFESFIGLRTDLLFSNSPT